MKIIGMCGGSASGKSTIIAMLRERFGDRMSVIDMDNYYISRDELPYDERKEVNYDLPESLDWKRILNDIRTLQKGEAVEQPFFSFTTYRREQETIFTKPAEILIIDGIFSLHFEKLREQYDLSVFLDVEAEVRFARRLLRNQRLYHRPLEFEVEQYFEKVRPMHEKYVEPCKELADLVLSFGKEKDETAARLGNIIEKLKE